MCCRDTMQKGRTFCINHPMVSVIRTTDRAQQSIQITDAPQTAKILYGLFMCFKRVTQGDPIMPFTDLPVASKRPYAW